MSLSVVVLVATLVTGTGVAGASAPVGNGAETVQAAESSSAVPTARIEPRSPVADRNDRTTIPGTGCRPGTGPPDPPTDRLGWERGCWFNESIAVNRSDGLTERELDVLVARTMARVERLRGLEFRINLTVQLRPRESFDRDTRTVPVAKVYRKNIHEEALFLLNESTDAVRYRLGVGGYYAYWDDRIVMISDDATVDTHEFNLAHELTHALQDDHFDPFGGSRDRFDRRKAKAALTEGAANYVVQDYKQRCQGAWNGTCFPPVGWSPNEETDPTRRCDGDPQFNWGNYLSGIFPHSDGPPFVAALRERGGWERVVEAYSRPPNSTEQVIHPEAYPTDRPANVTLRDRSGEKWRVVQPVDDEEPATLGLGEAAMYAMFWWQSFRTDSAAIIPCEHAFRAEGPRDIYNYSHPVTTGWDGDRLLPYVSASGVETRTANGTRSPDLDRLGYVWKSVWDSPRDAREFAAAYRDLLRAHDATPVSGRANTYRVPDASGFGDAFYLHVSNGTVLVVNAPSVQTLRELRPAAAPRESDRATAPSDPPDATRDQHERILGDSGAILVGVTTVLLFTILWFRHRRSSR